MIYGHMYFFVRSVQYTLNSFIKIFQIIEKIKNEFGSYEKYNFLKLFCFNARNRCRPFVKEENSSFARFEKKRLFIFLYGKPFMSMVEILSSFYFCICEDLASS